MCPASDIGKSVLLDAPRRTDAGSIEQELARLWKDTGEGTSGAASHLRACSLNLIIFTEGEGRATGLEDIVSEVTVDHPGRFFLISSDRRSATRAIDVWVSARCSVPVSGEQQVCCEEITVTVSGTDANKIPSIVTSLLVPDVPTILLWRAKPDGRDSILKQLAVVAERILIDSSEELDPLTSLIAWSSFIGRDRSVAACGDLAWTHLTPWRGLLAQSFQPREARDHLPALDRVTIEYSSTRTPLHSGLSQSFLAAAWLAHVLGWMPVHPFGEEGDHVFVAKLRSGEQAITVQLKEVPAGDARRGGIESVTLHSTRGGEILLRSVAGRTECVQLRSSLAGTSLREDTLMVRHQTEAELVSEELEVLYNDPLFEAAMLCLAGMIPGGTQ